MNKDISVKHKQKRILCFKTNQWLLFSSLLDSGYSFVKSLEIMNHKSKTIEELLNEGEDINKIVLQGQKGTFYKYLSFYLRFMSLSDSIKSAFKMIEFEKNCIKKIMDKCKYPIFILFLSFISIFLFSNYIIPQLLNSFDSTESIFISLLYLLKYITTILFLLFLLFIVSLILILLNTKIHKAFYTSIFFKISILKTYLSYYLCGYMRILNEQGLSSLQAFQYLCELNNKSYLSYLVHEINDELNKGIELNQIILTNKYLDNDFKMYFGIGFHNGTLNENLNLYLISAEIKIESLISIISTFIHTVSYSFIGILLICVYQIMLIPLEILEQF